MCLLDCVSFFSGVLRFVSRLMVGYVVVTILEVGGR